MLEVSAYLIGGFDGFMRSVVRASVYTAWAIGNFYNKGSFVAYLKCFMAYVFGFCPFANFAGIVTLSIYTVGS